MLLLILACKTTPTPTPAAPVAPAPAAPTTAPVVAPAPAATGGELTIQIGVDIMFTAAEVVCPSGFRQRDYFTDQAAAFTGLPAEACTLSFKGGPPAQFSPISAGSWSCRYSGTTMRCDRL